MDILLKEGCSTTTIVAVLYHYCRPLPLLGFLPLPLLPPYHCVEFYHNPQSYHYWPALPLLGGALPLGPCLLNRSSWASGAVSS
jgi:hypothetical protein